MTARKATATDERNPSYPVKANMAASEEDKLPEEELIGQMSYVYSLSLSMGIRSL